MVENAHTQDVLHENPAEADGRPDARALCQQLQGTLPELFPDHVINPGAERSGLYPKVCLIERGASQPRIVEVNEWLEEGKPMGFIISVGVTDAEGGLIGRAKTAWITGSLDKGFSLLRTAERPTVRQLREGMDLRVMEPIDNLRKARQVSGLLDATDPAEIAEIGERIASAEEGDRVKT